MKCVIAKHSPSTHGPTECSKTMSDIKPVAPRKRSGSTCICINAVFAVRCRDSILYRLVLAYFTTHDDWASQRNITIMCRVIPHIMRSFPAITRQTQDTFPHLRNAFPRSRLARILAHLRVSPCIFAFHRASSRSIAHLRVPSRIFAFHRASSRFTAHLRVSPRIFAFHRASSRFTAHLRVSPRIFAFHRASSHFIVI